MKKGVGRTVQLLRAGKFQQQLRNCQIFLSHPALMINIKTINYKH